MGQQLAGQLSDRQWKSDAFRAGGYRPAVANRFIRKLHEKIAQGRDLARRAAASKRLLRPRAVSITVYHEAQEIHEGHEARLLKTNFVFFVSFAAS